MIYDIYLIIFNGKTKFVKHFYLIPIFFKHKHVLKIKLIFFLCNSQQCSKKKKITLKTKLF